MLLKTFEKVNNATSTIYEVFNANGDWIETFIVDYRVERLESPDVHELNKAIIKRKGYEKENARVRFVSIDPTTQNLEVAITV